MLRLPSFFLFSVVNSVYPQLIRLNQSAGKGIIHLEFKGLGNRNLTNQSVIRIGSISRVSFTDAFGIKSEISAKNSYFSMFDFAKIVHLVAR